MRILGAVLAGGRSSRFGSDKALAEWEGRQLIGHVAAALGKQVDAMVVVGREASGVSGVPAIADRPAPDLGPLGGLNAALRHARDHGFDRVLSVGCDTPLLPPTLAATLAAAGAPAMLAEIPIIGLWPATLSARLDDHVRAGGDMSLRCWGALVGAARVASPTPIPNINSPDDLARLAGRRPGD